MTRLLNSRKRIILVAASINLMVAAVLIVDYVGLPDRAVYTGRVVQGEAVIAPEIRAIAPSFQLTKTDGESIRLDDLRGNPVVLNFWATWCEPCKVEMPALQSIYDDYEEQGLHILAINLGETSSTVSEWAADMKLSFDLLLDTDQEVAALYRLRGQPSTYVVSPSGIITNIYYGPVDTRTLRNALAPYFSS